jgi:ribosomal protein S12 methylthiotransferase accessory factor
MRKAAERARELFEALVGRRTGIVRQVSLVDPEDGDARLFHAGAQIANAHPYHGEHMGLGVGGCGVTPEDALVSALCEGVERHAASSYGPPPRGLHSRRSLGAERSIDPRTLVPFTHAQRASADFPLAEVDDDTPLRWVLGRDLASGEACWVPAFAVYLPYMLERDEPLVGTGLSTGLACGASFEEAVVKGICEAVERDAMALTWVCGITPPKLDRAVAHDKVGAVLPPRDDVTVYDLRTDVGLPAFFVSCTGMGPRGPLVAVGAACHLDPDAALRKAAMEASQDRVYVRLLMDRDPKWEPAPDFSNVTDFSLHARLYSHSPKLAHRGFAFLDEDSSGSSPFDETSATDLPSLVAALGRRGIDGAVVDLTPPWAAALGLSVVRVVLPGLVPLHGNHTLRFLGHPRLADWQKAMPRGRRTHDRAFWPYPHPMP